MSFQITKTNKYGDLPDPPAPDTATCTAMRNADRFDCFPQDGANQELCEARGCCWVPAQHEGCLFYIFFYMLFLIPHYTHFCGWTLFIFRVRGLLISHLHYKHFKFFIIRGFDMILVIGKISPENRAIRWRNNPAGLIRSLTI